MGFDSNPRKLGSRAAPARKPEQSIMRLPKEALPLSAQRSPTQILKKLISFARKSRYERAFAVRRYLGEWGSRIPHLGNDRTTYVIGLFGSGRNYITGLMLKHLGKRAKYLRETVRYHPGPTSMIYTGHATIRHASRGQELPAVTSRVLQAVSLGFADLIFINRHPLDSLLTNWIFWRIYIRYNIQVEGISRVYKNRDDLCSDLEQNFLEFRAFAEGDPGFFSALPIDAGWGANGSPRFLSFAEFVEEAELFCQSATLTLRLEDFMFDPLKEFSKIAGLMSVDPNLNGLSIAPPRTRPYGYLAVKEKAPRFRDFISDLDTETKRRIEKIGYEL